MPLRPTSLPPLARCLKPARNRGVGECDCATAGLFRLPLGGRITAPTRNRDRPLRAVLPSRLQILRAPVAALAKAGPHWVQQRRPRRPRRKQRPLYPCGPRSKVGARSSCRRPVSDVVWDIPKATWGMSVGRTSWQFGRAPVGKRWRQRQSPLQWQDRHRPKMPAPISSRASACTC